MLPVPRGAVRTRPASHEVPTRALGKIVRRTRHHPRGTLVDDAIPGRRERIHALADLPRAPGEVGVPHGREGVRVLPLRLIGGRHVGDAGVLFHVYPQRPPVGGCSRHEGDGRLTPIDVPPHPRRRPRIRLLPGDVKVEGRVRLVRAERVGVRVAAASAAERLARFPAIHRRRRRELLLGGHQARVRAPFALITRPSAAVLSGQTSLDAHAPQSIRSNPRGTTRPGASATQARSWRGAGCSSSTAPSRACTADRCNRTGSCTLRGGGAGRGDRGRSAEIQQFVALEFDDEGRARTRVCGWLSGCVRCAERHGDGQQGRSCYSSPHIARFPLLDTAEARDPCGSRLQRRGGSGEESLVRQRGAATGPRC